MESAAKQSMPIYHADGLPHRFALRNDNKKETEFDRLLALFPDAGKTKSRHLAMTAFSFLQSFLSHMPIELERAASSTSGVM